MRYEKLTHVFAAVAYREILIRTIFSYIRIASVAAIEPDRVVVDAFTV